MAVAKPSRQRRNTPRPCDLPAPKSTATKTKKGKPARPVKPEETTQTQTPPAFHIILHNHPASTPGVKSSPKRPNPILIQEANSFYPRTVTYEVQPAAAWQALKSYRKAKLPSPQSGVEDTKLRVGDCVYVNHTTIGNGLGLADDEEPWVAYILEFRMLDFDSVFARVYWAYRPQDLPQGRRAHHVDDEIIASNHMDIISAMTISDLADVTDLTDGKDSTEPVELFWRQIYDCLTQSLSTLPRDCTCYQISDPMELRIRCGNPDCELWLHSTCLSRQTLERELRGCQSALQKHAHNRDHTESESITSIQTEPVHPLAGTEERELHTTLEYQFDQAGSPTNELTGRLLIWDAADQLLHTAPLACLRCGWLIS